MANVSGISLQVLGYYLGYLCIWVWPAVGYVVSWMI